MVLKVKFHSIATIKPMRTFAPKHSGRMSMKVKNIFERFSFLRIA